MSDGLIERTKASAATAMLFLAIIMSRAVSDPQNQDPLTSVTFRILKIETRGLEMGIDHFYFTAGKNR